MPATSDGPGWAINPPAPATTGGYPPPSKAGGLARAHCRLTGHTGDWTCPDERCIRIRMCQRCGEITSKQEHTWSPFEYVAATRCEQERRCDRCGAAESRVQHSWGPWRYVGERDARQFTTCGRCGAESRTAGSAGSFW
jgi:hypothetical protein